MLVTLEEMKNYLRVDYEDDDALIVSLLSSAEKLCADITRSYVDELRHMPEAKIAIMYATAYLYEHREEADHHALTITLRSLLFGSRKEVF